MKSTDRQLFLRHQRRCVKCRQLKQVRMGQVVDRDYLILLTLHENNIRLLYHQGTPPGVLERVWTGLVLE